MTDNHPITPPPELMREWVGSQHGYLNAARWGADQELDACCQEVHDWYGNGSRLRDARRPKPPSLKEQALEILGYPKDFWSEDEVDTIRKALEQLND